jgi:hypothetical protein
MKCPDWNELEYNWFHPEEMIEKAKNSAEHQKILTEINKIASAHYLSLKKAKESTD